MEPCGKDFASPEPPSLSRDLAQQMSQMMELSDKKQTAIELLLQGHSDQEVENMIHVHRGSVWRWRSEDEQFMRSLRLARRRAVEAAVGELQQLVPKAIQVVREKLTEGNYNAAARVLIMCRVDRYYSW